jgi:hypothetical protein
MWDTYLLLSVITVFPHGLWLFSVTLRRGKVLKIFSNEFLSRLQISQQKKRVCVRILWPGEGMWKRPIIRALRDWLFDIGRDRDRFFAQMSVFSRDRFRFLGLKNWKPFSSSFTDMLWYSFCEHLHGPAENQFDYLLPKGLWWGRSSKFLSSTHCIEECLRWPPVKTLCQKLLKIDILLSHVKRNKMSMVTRPWEQNKISPKTMLLW